MAPTDRGARRAGGAAVSRRKLPRRLRPEPIASRVVREGRLHWTAWAMEPGGVWVYLARAFTRRGAFRVLRSHGLDPPNEKARTP